MGRSADWQNAPMTAQDHAKPQALPRSAYRVFRTLSTRWMDNDA